MITTLSILVSSSLAGFFILFMKINRIKKVNGVLPIKNKKWCKILIYMMLACIIFIILGITLFFALAK